MKEIRNIISFYDSIDWTKEKASLATVVNVEESAYRRIGARMFVKDSGDWIGGISGGCLEGDALKRAQAAIFREEPSIVVYDTMDDDAHQIGVGLGCNGRIEVLFTPIDHTDVNNPIERLRKILAKREPTIFYQVLTSDKNDFSLLGVFEEQSRFQYFLERTKLTEVDLLANTEVVKVKKKPKVFKMTTTANEILEVLVEFIRPELNLILIGDNYDVNAFVGIANELGWNISVVGLTRKLNKSVFQNSKKVVSYDHVDDLDVDAYTAVVLMSHDYKKDMHMLSYFLGKSPSYIGMLGPKKRMMKMQKELESELSDLDLEMLPHFYSPIGLDIGAESPEEIAISVAAEIIASLRKREGGFLRLRKGTIHERD